MPNAPVRCDETVAPGRLRRHSRSSICTPPLEPLGSLPPMSGLLYISVSDPRHRPPLGVAGTERPRCSLGADDDTMDNTDSDIAATLYAYTLERGDDAFVHQHVVDALCAQDADATTPPMRLVFALVGLYLHVERSQTGRQVQRVHAVLAQRKPVWPTLVLPPTRGALTAQDVLAAPAGPSRDAAIDAWCASVWTAYGPCRQAIVDFLQRYGSDGR